MTLGGWAPEADRALSDWRLPLDEPIFSAVNGLGLSALDATFVGASSLTFGIGCAALMALWLVFTYRRRALGPVLAFGVTLLTVDGVGAGVLKPFIGRLRPWQALDASSVRLLVEPTYAPSMPSLHAANSFAVATVMMLLVPRAGWLVLPVASLIAVSRIGVGVHWPSDVLAGALYGSAVAMMLVVGARRIWPTAFPPPRSSQAG